MKSRLKFFSLLAMFWLIFFELSRVLFLLYHFRLSSELPFSDLLLILVHGFRMDMSMTGYILLIPGLLLMLTTESASKWIYTFMKFYTSILLLIITFLTVADIELYRHWGFRLDDTPLLYIANPKEVAGSSDPWMTLILVLFWIFFFLVSLRVYRKFIASSINDISNGNWKVSVSFLLLTAFLILPIRGSFGQSNMNVGFVYFHNSNVYANHAAINGIWNVAYALNKINDSNYPNNFFGKEETAHHFNALYNDPGETLNVLKNKRPNVIIIALESYTSKIIEALGGPDDVTPNINRLVSEGIMFSNIYSSGDRTDKGIVSILSGYPAQPKTSIMKHAKKTQDLPYLSRELKKVGYHTGFTYGYDIDYANFRSYLTNAQFDEIKSDQDFIPEERNSKWGVHDHFVLNKIIDDLDNTKEPFFISSMTLSSHEPFEVPMETVFEGGDDEKFFNSAYYTDKSIGDFIEKAKTKKWWDNTIVILIADHGCRLPLDDPNYVPRRFSIPMLWLGGVLQLTDTTIAKYGSQTDIPKTLLSQMDLNGDTFEFSNNLLSTKSNSFAFYAFNNGFGFVEDGKTIVYDNSGKKFMLIEGNVMENDKNISKAYMQKIYSDFNAR